MRVVILDRDGVILGYEEGRFVNHPDQVELRPMSAEAIHLLNENNYKVIVASNQAGISLGFATVKDVWNCMARMRILLYEKAQAIIDKIYFCPHHPSIMECDCRKPKIGMYKQMIEDGIIRTPDSITVVGDAWTDIKFGENISARTIAIVEGGEWGKRDDNNKVSPGFKYPDLYSAVCKIIELDNFLGMERE